MPLLYEKTFEEIQAESLQELLSSTNITRVTPGSKAQALSEIFSRKLNQTYQDFDINFLRTFLPFAQGRFLDYIGDMLNVPRTGSTRASTSSRSELVKVFVDDGTFGDLNEGSSITIPTGTLITTFPNNDGLVYRVSNAVVLPSGDSEIFIPVESVTDGTAGNVGPNTLRFSIFSDYSDGVGLKFTNPGALINGRDIESDTNYRFRISNQILAAEAANETAVRLSLLTVPGVSDFILIPYSRGIGTFDYVIQTVVPNTPLEIIEECQNRINRTQAQGLQGRALAPGLVGMSFVITVTWTSDTLQSERPEIKSLIGEALQDYINNLAIGEEFIYNEAIQRVMEVSTKIKNIGTARNAFDEIFIYRNSKIQKKKSRESLIEDFKPDSHERLIIEPSQTTPIIILDKN